MDKQCVNCKFIKGVSVLDEQGIVFICDNQLSVFYKTPRSRTDTCDEFRPTKTTYCKYKGVCEQKEGGECKVMIKGVLCSHQTDETGYRKMLDEPKELNHHNWYIHGFEVVFGKTDIGTEQPEDVLIRVKDDWGTRENFLDLEDAIKFRDDLNKRIDQIIKFKKNKEEPIEQKEPPKGHKPISESRTKWVK